MTRQRKPSTQLTRRGVLTLGGTAVAGIAGGFVVGERVSAAQAADTASPPDREIVPFYARHQAGVATPGQTLTTFVGVNVREPARKNTESVLRLLSDDAARLTQGLPALADTEPQLTQSPNNLTVSIGLGRALMTRTGLAANIPKTFVDIPTFTTDAIEPGWEQSDLIIQIGTDDPLVLAHTVRMLTKDIAPLTHIAWVQDGFRNTRFTGNSSKLDRNLMGQVEGTDNPPLADFDHVVWVPETGGTILVLRRIRMLLDTWDALDTSAKEMAIGRQLDSGAPMGGTHEKDPVPFDEVDELGLPIIAQDAHIRLAHATSAKERIYRRGYSYNNGMRDGTNDMGLIFAAYMNDPTQSFIPIQKRLAAQDAFNRWISTIGTSTYYFPAGCTQGGYIGQELFI